MDTSFFKRQTKTNIFFKLVRLLILFESIVLIVCFIDVKFNLLFKILNRFYGELVFNNLFSTIILFLYALVKIAFFKNYKDYLNYMALISSILYLALIYKEIVIDQAL